MSISQSQINTVGRDQVNITNNAYTTTQESILASLKPVDRSVYYVPPCMQGTRQWVIDKIENWINDPHAPNILWLNGGPGAGKSAIASTMVSRLAETGKLGSNFFFKRGDSALSDPAVVWRTVAFDLARTDACFAEKLINNLTENKAVVDRADIASHFKHFIEEPCHESWSKRTNQVGEIAIKVVVMDAMDECGFDSSLFTQRNIFMTTIIAWSKIHPSFRLFITSRDHLITPSFRNVCRHISLETGELATPEMHTDIQTFFEHNFTEIANRYPSLQSWPGQSTIVQLTARAAGLFIWADTVMRFVRQGFPKTQLKRILDGGFREGGDAIDQLYKQIFFLSFPNSDLSDTERRVLGAIVLAKTPLYRADLGHFLEIDEDESSIDFILESLSSVIMFRSIDHRIHVCHLSFIEFLCDSRRCPVEFYIDHGTHSRIFTLACLRAMKESLRFKICNIETSYLRNDDLDLAPRIKAFIPTHLLYACTYWAAHLHHTTADAVILVVSIA